MVTDKLASYGVACRALLPSVERFRSAAGAQRFLSCFSAISPHFRPRRHRLTAAQYRHQLNTRFTTWNQVTGLAPAAS